MSRPVTLFTGQWADLPLEVICEKASKWGYEGIELPCWGDHFNVQKALSDEHYCKGRHELLGKYGLKVWAISNHLVGQAVCDLIDERHKLILPDHVGAGTSARRAAARLISTPSPASSTRSATPGRSPSRPRRPRARFPRLRPRSGRQKGSELQSRAVMHRVCTADHRIPGAGGAGKRAGCWSLRK